MKGWGPGMYIEGAGRCGMGTLNQACPAPTPTPPFLRLQGCVFVSVRTLGAKHSCLPAITMATHPDWRERRGRPLPLLGNAMLCQAYSQR